MLIPSEKDRKHKHCVYDVHIYSVHISNASVFLPGLASVLTTHVCDQTPQIYWCPVACKEGTAAERKLHWLCVVATTVSLHLDRPLMLLVLSF